MSKAILLSIKPQFVSKILNGEKTIEIRKHAIPVGTKVYVYCTMKRKMGLPLSEWNGKVVASFVVSKCEKIGIITAYHLSCSRLSQKEMENYKGKKKIYALHISQLKIFDRPKKLGMFYKLKPRDNISSEIIHLTKAPQSYCYVEEL